MSRAWPVPDLDQHAPLASNVRLILAVRITELRSYDAVIPDPTAVQGLHDTRIAAKRLRYTLELFLPLLGEAGEQAVAQIRDLQDVLGLLHDYDMRIALLNDELAAHSRGGRSKAARFKPGLEYLLRAESSDRDICYAEAVKRWRDVTEGEAIARLTAFPGIEKDS